MNDVDMRKIRESTGVPSSTPVQEDAESATKVEPAEVRNVHAGSKEQKRKRRGKYARRADVRYWLWLCVAVAFGVLVGIWIGRNLVLSSFNQLNTTVQEPELVSDKVVTMESMNWVYTQSSPYRPNEGYSEIYFGAQLFQSNDYVVYIQDSTGTIWHTPLSQCKLAVNDEDPNTVHIKEFAGIQHPYIVFSMNAEEFSANVSPLFMDGFTDGMVNFVYQFLAETLPTE